MICPVCWLSTMSLNSEWIQLLIDFSLQRENKLQLQVHRQGSVNRITVEKWALSVQCKRQFRTLSGEVQSMKKSKHAIPMSTSYVTSNFFPKNPVFVCLSLFACLFVYMSYHRPRNHWRKIACSLPLSVPLLCYKDAARHATEAGISRTHICNFL